MKGTITIENRKYKIDFNRPIDISIVLKNNDENPRAWHQDIPVIEPVKMGNWIGRISDGASVNFNNITFSPHAHGTHTESFAHISKDFFSINQALKTFFFLAEVVSIQPEQIENDRIITLDAIRKKLNEKAPKAVVIRTLPNPVSKKSERWTNSNWPYLSEVAALHLREMGVEHLLIDVPSVDKEKDEGKLLAHKAFWNYPQNPRKNATITEMVFVPDEIPDGKYFLNLQIASFENDASPSKPILYEISEVKN